MNIYFEEHLRTTAGSVEITTFELLNSDYSNWFHSDYKVLWQWKENSNGLSLGKIASFEES